MINLIRIVLLSAFLGVTATACAAGEVKLDAVDNGSQIELERGQFLEVSLEGNPTTGYSWEAAYLEDQILRQAGDPEFTPETDLIGSGGVQTLRFEAVKSGQTTLKLVYRRPWEGDVNLLKTFSVKVVVR
ncbi:MAG: protease inhibitor I42 family protein [Anaerolineales bacterium]